ncbi:MAG: AbrB/MazE/SpoVT family DNA-binding domain-containing protein [Akkermansiaceae bacterium]
MTTTVTGRNQVTIPAALVVRMDLKRGTRIEWLPGEESDEFVCRVVPDPARLAAELRGAGRVYLKTDVRHPIEALVAERSEDELGREKNL